MVRDFQSVIGREARAQMLERAGGCRDGGGVRGRRLQRDGHLPAFRDDAEVELVGVEAAGEGLDTDRHSASLTRGRPACCTAR
jgi:tryptophan synthase beta subunit